MESSSPSPKELRSFEKLVETETQKVSYALMDGEDVAQMILSAYLIFQLEIEKALKNKNGGGAVGGRLSNDNIVHETPGMIVDEFAKINELCQELKMGKNGARGVEP